MRVSLAHILAVTRGERHTHPSASSRSQYTVIRWGRVSLCSSAVRFRCHARAMPAMWVLNGRNGVCTR